MKCGGRRVGVRWSVGVGVEDVMEGWGVSEAL